MEQRKKILIFSGAGVSKESGIETFRDSKDGLWNNFSIEDVATLTGWTKDKETVLNFYNERRAQLKEVHPNLAHRLIAELENFYDVTVVTQNVDDLHERAGSTNVIHLHGELTKVRSTMDPSLVYDWKDDLNIGDRCDKGSQLRPHIVWFGEALNPVFINEAIYNAENCDYCIIVGTSLQVSPANEIPFLTNVETPIYYIEPSNIDMLMYDIPDYKLPYFKHIKKVATKGMQEIFKKLDPK